MGMKPDSLIDQHFNYPRFNDDLLSQATKRLSKFGRVISGLPEEDVGHMQPNFPDERSETERHSFMAVVEWWILAHSNWLVGHVGSSFAETAGAGNSHGMQEEVRSA